MTRFTLAVILSAAALTTAAAPAFAQNQEMVTRDVNFRSVDLQSASGVRKVYDRIEATADSLCGGMPGAVERGARQDYQVCHDQAVKDAVRQINAPLLTALISGGFPVMASN